MFYCFKYTQKYKIKLIKKNNNKNKIKKNGWMNERMNNLFVQLLFHV